VKERFAFAPKDGKTDRDALSHERMAESDSTVAGDTIRLVPTLGKDSAEATAARELGMRRRVARAKVR